MDNAVQQTSKFVPLLPRPALLNNPSFQRVLRRATGSYRGVLCMEILLLKSLVMYYFFIDLLEIIPLPPYSYLGRW